MIAPAFQQYASASKAILQYWAVRNNTSHDPYDGLQTSWPSSSLPLVLRLGLVQLHKRSPINLRRLFGIHPSRNPYGEALFVSARLALWHVERDRLHLDEALRSLEWLSGQRLRGGWAYPFDVQTKTFFYPRSTPNVVCTSFAGHAFLDASEITGDARWLEIAEDAAHFALSELLMRERGNSYFAYLPGDHKLIHNANLLAARLCVRTGRLAQNPGLVEAGCGATDTTLSHQRPDGSFLYGFGRDLAWIDGHHTGFVVECLADLLRTIPEVAGSLRRAADYYKTTLFYPNGRPRPNPGASFPVDVIAGAQGIQTFAKLGDVLEACRIADWMLSHMRTGEGRYVYQRRRLHKKAVPYARWSDAPMALALAILVKSLSA